MEVVAEAEGYGGWDQHASCHSQFISHGKKGRARNACGRQDFCPSPENKVN